MHLEYGNQSTLICSIRSSHVKFKKKIVWIICYHSNKVQDYVLISDAMRMGKKSYKFLKEKGNLFARQSNCTCQSSLTNQY